jgi:hypothetical protein
MAPQFGATLDKSRVVQEPAGNCTVWDVGVAWLTLSGVAWSYLEIFNTDRDSAGVRASITQGGPSVDFCASVAPTISATDFGPGRCTSLVISK